MNPALHEPSQAFVNRHAKAFILALAVFSLSVYVALAVAGDLRERLALYLLSQALLAGAMWAAWRLVVRTRNGLSLVVAGAVVFRLVAAWSEPSLSDDVYRYVWDGRVQLHGVHPYRYAPVDASLAELRDASWARINHPELKTIYPPLAQVAFLLLASCGAGPTGFKLAMGLVDLGVLAALACLLRRLKLPADRLVLYAWNPLAVWETAGSGHVEPLGVALTLLAGLWIIERRDALSTTALAGAIHVKLLPIVLLPMFWRRLRPRFWLLLGLALAVPILPYALTGPPLGAGLVAYAERWEYNAFGYAGVELLMERLDTGNSLKPLVDRARASWTGLPVPWESVYEHIWPRDVARLAVVLLAGLWVIALAWRADRDLPREMLLVFGGVLLLLPTVHPWYVLWVLPLAVVSLSWGWLLFALTVPLAYTGGEADVSWPIRLVEYLPPLFVMLWTWLGTARERRPSRRLGKPW